MNFPFYIAKRYFLTRKLRNIINIISLISVVGVMIGTMALVVVLSVFNGFDSLMRDTYKNFDPDLEITVKKGKTFLPQGKKFKDIKEMPGVKIYSESLEENALIRYEDKQYIGRIKGVEDNYDQLSGIKKVMYAGDFKLKDADQDFAVIGSGVARFLTVNINYPAPLILYVPERGQTAMLNPQSAFNKKMIYPSGIFRMKQNYDLKYILVPLDFARDILEYEDKVTEIEIKIAEGAKVEKVKEKIKSKLGPDFEVKDIFEQHELFFKVMKSEKWYVFLILTFILIVASFNIIGSISMLIIDKKNDIALLRSLGAKMKTIRRIFFLEGSLISFIGAMLGVLLGILICWMQTTFEIISLGSQGAFIIDYYPVEVHFLDVTGIFFTVVLIGFLAAYYPVRYITRRYAQEDYHVND